MVLLPPPPNVVLRRGQTASEPDLREFCKRHIAGYKAVRGAGS